MARDAESKRRRTINASSSDIDGLSDQLQSVSLAISAAMDRGIGEASENPSVDNLEQTGMEELRRWYQTEVFAASDAQQYRWEERRWAFFAPIAACLTQAFDTHGIHLQY